MTTTTTSGAADLPEALRRSTAADGKTELFNLPGYPLMVRAVDFNRIHAESEMRRAALLDEMQKAALAAGQATAAQAVVPAEWPTNEMIDAGRKAAASQGRLLGSGQSLWHVFRAMLAAAPAQPAAQQGVAYAALPEYGINTASHAHFRVLGFTADQMRAFADATHTLRASHGEAPASVLHLVHSAFAEIAMAFPKAFALHKVGIADTAVREALAAPATQQAGEVRPVTPYTCPKCHALWLHWPAEQTGFGRDTLNCRSADHCHYCEKAGVEQLQRLERIPAALHAPQPSPTAPAPAEIVPAPPPPPECETEAEKRAFAFGWFKALESERMKADNKKKDPL